MSDTMTMVVDTAVERKRSRAWCFTMFEEADVERIKATGGITALVIGREICPSTGKVHYQGYVRFAQVCRFSWWRNNFPSVHVEERKGTEGTAAAYCRKDGDVVVDFGCMVDKQAPTMKESGEYKDKKVAITEEILDMIDAGAPLHQVRKRNRVFFFHNYRKLKDYKDQVDFEKEMGYTE